MERFFNLLKERKKKENTITLHVRLHGASSSSISFLLSFSFPFVLLFLWVVRRTFFSEFFRLRFVQFYFLLKSCSDSQQVHLFTSVGVNPTDWVPSTKQHQICKFHLQRKNITIYLLLHISPFLGRE